MYGVNVRFLLLQCVPATILLLGALFSLFVLLQVRHATLSEGVRVAWVALVLLVPFFGALAFLIVRPGDDRETNDE